MYASLELSLFYEYCVAVWGKHVYIDTDLSSVLFKTYFNKIWHLKMMDAKLTENIPNSNTLHVFPSVECFIWI